MLAKTKFLPKNPLSKAQNKLLKNSLKLLLGNGLIEEKPEQRDHKNRAMVLKNALNAVSIDITE
jgi:hypothetical protein